MSLDELRFWQALQNQQWYLWIKKRWAEEDFLGLAQKGNFVKRGGGDIIRLWHSYYYLVALWCLSQLRYFTNHHPEHRKWTEFNEV